MSKDNIIEFVEVEYHPQSFRKRNGPMVAVHREPDDVRGIELEVREPRGVLTKAPGMHTIGRVDGSVNGARAFF